MKTSEFFAIPGIAQLIDQAYPRLEDFAGALRSTRTGCGDAAGANRHSAKTEKDPAKLIESIARAVGYEARKIAAEELAMIAHTFYRDGGQAKPE